MKIGDTYRLRNGKFATIIKDKEFTFEALVTEKPPDRVHEFSKETLNCLSGQEFDAMELNKVDPYGGI